MLPEVLDNIFPYLMLGYGAVVTAVLSSPLITLAETRLPRKMTAQLFAHRTLALACVAIGFLWAMQDLWLAA